MTVLFMLTFSFAIIFRKNILISLVSCVSNEVSLFEKNTSAVFSDMYVGFVYKVQYLLNYGLCVWLVNTSSIPFFREGPGEACRPLRAPEAPAPRAERCILGGERMWGAVLGEGEKRKRLLL